ncbi:GNAT family N-acetyltransferase [Allorhizobium terrae]|uniref:GNAT family N-acetyltransferase n=1 Tax=Allorhizobium terrae TaxID=1848972 RepID=A0A4S4A2J5_9HYPH|nr:GNAT family N-acetyltransferase [Allorhizobium terrae]
MALPRIEIIETGVTSEHEASILRPLLEYNNQAARHASYNEFAILLRDSESNDVTGGLYGQFDHGWAFVKLLIVPEAYRRLGLGRQLMELVETLARRHNCEGLWLDTFDFQAKPFYEKLGFTVFGELEAGNRADGRYFLKKRFTP